MLRFLQQLRVIDQVKAQGFAALGVVGPAGDLDQATAAILGAVPRLRVAKVSASFISGLSLGWAPYFSDVLELARLMADLRDERRHALQANDLVVVHGGV